jgi:hypothetical protein
MPHQTLGVWRGNASGLQKLVNRGAGGRPISFFEAATPVRHDGEFLWAVSGVAAASGRLLLLATRVLPDSSAPLGFRVRGTAAVVVEGVHRPPPWQYTVSDVPLTNGTNNWYTDVRTITGDGVAAHETDWVYVAGTSNGATTLGRAPLGSLMDGRWEALQVWGEGGRWSNTATTKPEPLFPAQSEATLNFHPGLGKWISFAPAAFGSRSLELWSAPRITGPWSSMGPIYKVPDFGPPNYFTYAVKGHPELEANSSEIIFR